MVKSVLGVSHRGLRDWIIQRMTAVILAIGILWLAIFFIINPHVDFLEWRMFFYPLWMRVLTLLFMISLAFHAWIGVWTVITDYVKPALLRFLLHIAVFLTLFLCVLWTLLMMWSF